MFCPKCGKELKDGTKFCTGCGAQLNAVENEEINTVEATEEAVVEETTDVKSEVVNDLENVETNSSEEIVNNEQVEIKQKKSFGKKAIIIIAIIAVLAIIFGVVFIKFFRNKKTVDVGKSLFYADEIALYELKDGAKEADKLITLNEGGYTSYDVISGDYLVYYDKNSNGDSVLYCKNLKDESNPVKIAVNADFECDKEGKLLIYMKNNGQGLYTYDFEGHQNKIASDVITFIVNENFDSVIYVAESNDKLNVYKTTLGKDSKTDKIIHDIEEIYYSDETASSILYGKDGSVYKYNGETSNKLVNDVYDVYGYNKDSDTFYFTRENKKAKLLADYINDDFEKHVPSGNDYYSTLIRNAYNSDIEKITDESNGFDTYSLYYYNGTKENLISKDVYEVVMAGCDLVVYSEFDESKIKKAKISELDSFWDISNARENTLTQKLCLKSDKQDLDLKDAEQFNYDVNNKTIYYVKDITENKKDIPVGTLYKSVINEDGKLDMEEIVQDDVYSYNIIEEKLVWYINETDNGYCDLYVDGTFISSDILVGDKSMKFSGNKMYFYRDYNFDEEMGSLCVWDGETVTKISDDVNYFEINDNGNIYLAKNYNNDKFDLYVYNGSEETQIAFDVVSFNYGNHYGAKNSWYTYDLIEFPHELIGEYYDPNW